MFIPILGIQIQTAETHTKDMEAAYQAGKSDGIEEERRFSTSTIHNLTSENADRRKRLGMIQ